MKRIYLLLIFLFGSFLLIYLLTKNLGRENLPADLLPKNAILYFEMDEPVKRFKKFQQSRLGRQIAEIDGAAIGLELGISKQSVSEMEEQFAGLIEFIESPLCNELFGRKIVLALLETDTKQSLDIQKVSENFVLIAKPRHETSLLEVLSSWFIKDLQHSTELYQGVTIKHFALEENRTASVAIVDDFLLASFSPATLKLCLNNVSGVNKRKTALSDNLNYNDFRADAGSKVDTFMFADAKKIGSVIKGFDLYLEKALQNAILAQLNNMGVLAVSSFRESKNDIHQYTTVLKLDKTQKKSFKDLLEPGVADENRIIKSIPADLLVYYWTNWFEPQSLWSFLTPNNKQGNDEIAKKLEQWILKNTGKDLESFLNMFGKQFSFHVADIKTTGFFPVPRMSFVFEVFDREGVGKILEKLFSDLQIDKSEISGVEILSIMVAGGLMQPSYAFFENCLLVADSREQLAILLEGNRKKLIDDPDFKKVDVGLTEPSNQILFARADKVNEGLQQLASWVGTIIAIRNAKAGIKSKIIVDQMIIPLLEGLKMYQVVGHRGFHKDGRIFLQTAVVINEY